MHADHLDTALLLTDSTQQVVWRYARDPFGELVAGAHTVRWPLRFPGQYEDAETGLFYNYFRDYDPQMGRYIESDPIGLGGGINTYAYALGNPVSFVDPLGLTTWPANGSVTSGFGSRVHPVTGQVSSHHNGIDIANPMGGVVVASDGGVVVSITSSPSGANQVIIQHPDGSRTGYAHTDPCVKVGDKVNEGQPIGSTDTSGRSTGPHTHYTYRPGVGSPPVDPLIHLPARR